MRGASFQFVRGNVVVKTGILASASCKINIVIFDFLIDYIRVFGCTEGVEGVGNQLGITAGIPVGSGYSASQHQVFEIMRGFFVKRIR